MNNEFTLDAVHKMIDALVSDVKDFATDQKKNGSESGKTAAVVEEHVFRRLLDIGRHLLEEYFRELGPGDEGFRLEHNGAEFTRKIRGTVSVLTVFGILEVDRWMYHTAGFPCFCPTEEAASLPDRQASYFVQRLTSRFSTRDTYNECVTFLKEMFGISLSTHTVMEMIASVSSDHAAYAEQLAPPPAAPEETIQVVSFDGKGVPMVKQDTVRPAARLHRGEKRNRKKEAMVGIEYVAAPNVRSPELLAKALVFPEDMKEHERQQLHAAGPARNLYYQASLEVGREGIIREIADRAVRRQEVTNHALQQVCLIDGARSQMQLCREIFPDAICVLDIIHVTERLWNAAHLFHAEGSGNAKCMVHDLLLRTLQGKVGYVIGGLKRRATKEKIGKRRMEKLREILTYLENHRDYMHYNHYLHQGFPISTGAVESACGHLVKDRMEKSGARWSLPGGEAMLRLRAIYASGNFNDYFKFHQQQNHQRIYGAKIAA